MKNKFIAQNYPKISKVIILSLLLNVSNTGYSVAQELAQLNNPNQDRLLPGNTLPITPEGPEERGAQREIETPERQDRNERGAETAFVVRFININPETTLYQSKELEAQLQQLRELEGKLATQAQIEEAVANITRLYLREGYLTSQAVLKTLNQEINAETGRLEGEVEIEIIEGRLDDEDIQIEGAGRLEGYVRSRIKLGAGKPLNIVNLEEQLRLLKADPLFENVEVTLGAGEEGSGTGNSVLRVRVTQGDLFRGGVGFDNYSPPSVGDVRFKLNLTYLNLIGFGDSIVANYIPRVETIDGTYQLEFIYRAPINPMNGTIQLRALIERNEVIQGQFKDFDIRGESEYYEISYRQPLIRSSREELALSIGFAYRDGQTFTFVGPTPFGLGPDEEGITKTSVIKFGQDYVSRDTTGAWGLRSQFSVGIDVFDATNNPKPIPDSNFFSVLGQIQRVQVLNKDNLLIIQLDGQLAADSLLPSEQFVIGGGQSVRGYRQNVRAGDNGVRFSIEDRITIVRDESGNSNFAIAPFFDLGYVWNNSSNPNFIADQKFIAGLGLGFLWQPVQGFNIRLDYAPPLIDLDDKGDNVQDHGFYFDVQYNF